MDLNTGIGILIQFFSEKDVFSMDSNYRELDWKTLNQQGEEPVKDSEAKIIIQAALDELVQGEMLKKIESGAGRNKTINYIIINSMKDSPVELVISKQTAKNIKTVVGSLVPMVNLEYQYDINDSNLDESDVIMLLECINILSSQLQQEIEKSKSPPKTSGNNNDLTIGI